MRSGPTMKRSTNGEKRFICTYGGCGKKFAQRGALETHWNTHTQEKPYVCRVEGCEFRFGDPSSRGRHERERHQNGRFVCPFLGEGCDTAIKRRPQFVRHLRERHSLSDSYVDSQEYIRAQWVGPDPAPGCRSGPRPRASTLRYTQAVEPTRNMIQPSGPVPIPAITTSFYESDYDRTQTYDYYPGVSNGAGPSTTYDPTATINPQELEFGGMSYYSHEASTPAFITTPEHLSVPSLYPSRGDTPMLSYSGSASPMPSDGLVPTPSPPAMFSSLAENFAVADTEYDIFGNLPAFDPVPIKREPTPGEPQWGSLWDYSHTAIGGF